MKNYRKLKQVMRMDLDVRASNKTRDRMRDLVLNTHRPAQRIEPGSSLIMSRSNVIKDLITKAILAAVVVAALVLGLSQLGNSSSGVAWGEVVGKVESSQGVTYRVRDYLPGKPETCKLFRRSSMHSRTDWYEGETHTRTMIFNLETNTQLWLAHDTKLGIKREMSAQSIESIRSEWTTPEPGVKRALSGSYHKLGRKTIDDILCEGVEVTDPNVIGRAARLELWVSIETGYPVFVKIEVPSGNNDMYGKTSIVIVDQYNWNVVVNASTCEFEIPSDYRIIDRRSKPKLR